MCSAIKRTDDVQRRVSQEEPEGQVLSHRQMGPFRRLRLQSPRGKGQTRTVHRQGGRGLARRGRRPATGRPHPGSQRREHRREDAQAGRGEHKVRGGRDQAARHRPQGRGARQRQRHAGEAPQP